MIALTYVADYISPKVGVARSNRVGCAIIFVPKQIPEGNANGALKIVSPQRCEQPADVVIKVSLALDLHP